MVHVLFERQRGLSAEDKRGKAHDTPAYLSRWVVLGQGGDHGGRTTPQLELVTDEFSKRGELVNRMHAVRSKQASKFTHRESQRSGWMHGDGGGSVTRGGGLVDNLS